MDCPVCNDVKLTMSDRQGIEIDYCPQCRGVWLDRGELDKLIERSSAEVPQQQPQQPQQPQYQQQQNVRPPPFEQSRHDHRDSDHYRQKKKKNLLGELFDF